MARSPTFHFVYRDIEQPPKHFNDNTVRGLSRNTNLDHSYEEADADADAKLARV